MEMGVEKALKIAGQVRAPMAQAYDRDVEKGWGHGCSSLLREGQIVYLPQRSMIYRQPDYTPIFPSCPERPELS
jgi:hypothetical protein